MSVMKMSPWKLERSKAIRTPFAMLPCLALWATIQPASAQQSPAKPAAPIAQFVDIAEKSGIVMDVFR